MSTRTVRNETELFDALVVAIEHRRPGHVYRLRRETEDWLEDETHKRARSRMLAAVEAVLNELEDLEEY